MAPTIEQIIGFSASSVLLATLIHQVWKQWSSGKSEGVSPWLFVGQAVANIGMLAYSILLGDTVFIVTNSATLATSCLGFAVQMRHAARASASRGPAASAVSSKSNGLPQRGELVAACDP